MKCSYCGEEIEDGLEVCPYCNGEAGKEIKEPPADKENNEAKATVKKVTPADKNDEPPTPKAAKVKAPGRGMLVSMGAVCVVMLVGLIVMSVLFIKTNNELAEAKDSVGRLEYQLAAAQSASSSGKGQVDTSALPPAPASYKGTTEGISWEAYKIGNNKCAMLVEPTEDGFSCVSLNLKFKNAAGATIAAKDANVNGLVKGKKSFAYGYDAADFYDIEVTVGNKSSYMKAYELEESHSIVDKKVIVDLKNNGNQDPIVVTVWGLFSKNGEVVDCTLTYASSIGPGSSQAVELSPLKDFDSVQVFVDSAV